MKGSRRDGIVGPAGDRTRSRLNWLWVPALAWAACVRTVTNGPTAPVAVVTGGSSQAGSVGSGGSLGTKPISTGGTWSAGSRGAGSSGGTFVNPAPGSKFFLGVNLWNFNWQDPAEYFRPGVDFATETNPWQPQFLQDLAPFHVIRFMDWNLTNQTNNVQATWSTRKKKTDSQGEAVAFEWQIDLCNRTKKDYWINVPHEASAAHWTSLAQLIRDQLDGSLRVYVEYSNEVWNGAFPQNGYAASQANALGLAGSNPSASYTVYEAVRIFEAFEAVFGKGNPRLVKVLAGQAAWTGPCLAHVAALGDAKINPNKTRPDVYAVAPYVVGNTTAALTSAIPEASKWTRESAQCALTANLPLISYEGGSDSFSAPHDGCRAIMHEPAMRHFYASYLDALVASGMKGPFMQYTHSGTCWGLKEKTSDALSASPKYQGVLDWVAAHP
jgi:hypothetical protein